MPIKIHISDLQLDIYQTSLITVKQTTSQVFLDFKKAFDSLEWNFMSKTLNKFGFGEYFKSWVNILYTESTITIKIMAGYQENKQWREV